MSPSSLLQQFGGVMSEYDDGTLTIVNEAWVYVVRIV